MVLTDFRAYDPQLAIWLSADPIGEAGGLNLYAYCYGNPLNLYDPDGLTAAGFFHGVGSYFRGNYRGGRQYMRFTGTLGTQEQLETATEMTLVYLAIDRYRTDSCFHKAVNKGLERGAGWFMNHKGDYAVGRFATEFLMTKGLTAAAGPVGLGVGVGLGANAIYGDFSRSIEIQIDRLRALGLSEAQILTTGLAAMDIVSAAGSGLSGSDERIPGKSKSECP